MLTTETVSTFWTLDVLQQTKKSSQIMENEDIVSDFLRSCAARESKLSRDKFERLVRIFKAGRRRR